MELAAHMPRDHVEPVVVTYHDLDFYGQLPRYEHVEVVHLPKSKKIDARVVAKLVRLIRKRRIDIVHAFLLPAGAWALAAALAAPSVRIICSERSDASAGPAEWHVMRWLTFPRADLVIANSQRSAQHIQSRFRLPAGHVAYVPNGIDFAHWSAPVPPSAAIEGLFARLTPGRPRLASVGTICAWKDHATLVRAVALLPPERRPCVVIAGRVGELGLARDLDALIVRLGLERFIARSEAVPDPRVLYQAVDALVLPSLFEGFPNVALEAMASGKPILATPVSDLPTWVTSEGLGWLFEVGDAAGLANALDALYSEGHDAVAARGRRCAEWAATFTIERTVADTLRCYRSLIGEGAAE